MIDTAEQIQKMEMVHPLIEPVLLTAIRSLHLPLGSHGLDAGCGIGLPACMLAEEVGPTGSITCVDHSPEYLSYAKKHAGEAGYEDQIAFREADLNRFAGGEDAYDWVWSSSCVGYSPDIDPYRALSNLAGLIKPGGSLVLIAWSSERLLPGYPLLEAHLNATRSGLAPFGLKHPPDRHFLRALDWFRKAGLKQLSAQSFLGDVQAPLNETMRNALTTLFEMRWTDVKKELPGDDVDLYRRLCLPDSREFIINQPGYYAFFTLTMFSGTVPG